MDIFNTIQKIIEKLPAVYDTCEVDLSQAFGRVLRQDVLADINMPPFDKSAMDGYACRLSDIENDMEVLEIIQAGSLPAKSIRKNQCSKIMTGAAVPQGADCVFKVEDSEQIAENRVRCTNPKTHKNICYLGEDYKKGDVLLKSGTIINTSQLAVLAGAGCTKVKVTKQPKIAIITTGSELVEPDKFPKPGQIRNSNTTQLLSQLYKTGLKPIYLGIAPDNYDQLLELFVEAINNYDIVFFTGGASMGDFDWIPTILKNQGFKIFWDRTGMKPGNPMTFAEKDSKFCFGLSGNPVSSMVQFEIIAKPVLYKLMGTNYTPVRIKTTLQSNYRRKKNDRLAIVPVQFNSAGEAEIIDFHGSAHINALAFANAFLEVPGGVSEIKKGEQVYVRPL